MDFQRMLADGNFKPPHKLGDSIYTIADYNFSDSISCFELKVHECKGAVNSIMITESGFEYYSMGMTAPFAYDDRFECEGDFWTREEAESYLKELEPIICTFHRGDLIYYYNSSSSRIKEAEVTAVTYYNGKVTFETDEGFSFTSDELNDKYFRSKKEAQKQYVQCMEK
jgi:hypothetical protein